MSLIALKCDAEGTVVGYTIVPDLATLRIQPWPADRYTIVPEDHEMVVDWEDDRTGPIPIRRPRYSMRPRPTATP